MKRKLLFAMLVLLSATVYAGSKIKRPESYNYMRGVDAYKNQNNEEALDYLNKELSENPKNGYAYVLIASIREEQKEHGLALSAVNQSLRWLPKKDKEYLGVAYSVRARLFLNMNDTVQAVKDLGKMIECNPEDIDGYEMRAQIFYQRTLYDLADADYQKIIELNQGNVLGYMGLGRNYMARKKWDDALREFEKAGLLDVDFSQVYAYKAECYLEKEDWNKATDNIIKALAIDFNNKAFNMICNKNDDYFRLMDAKLQIQQTKNPNEETWPYSLGVLYEGKNDFRKAIEYYKDALDLQAHSVYAERIANCYSEIGSYPVALEYINMAQELDSTDADLIWEKADILYYNGQTEEAIEELTRFIELFPEDGGAYYQRGFYKDNANMVEEAINDYSLCIALEPEYAYAFLGRGDQYMKQGKLNMAMADYRKVVEIDTIPSIHSCAQYAYFQLGEKEKAVAFIDSSMTQFPNNPSLLYDAACLYARMREPERAIDYLRQALENGFCSINHIRIDDDLDELREIPAFKKLVDEYMTKLKSEETGLSLDNVREEIIEIPFFKDAGNLCNVKCTINGLPLSFIIDTGASDVSISQVEANFMMKNGFLTQKDIIGNRCFRDALGNISVGTVINVRKVNLGGLVLTNVKASVVKTQKAPLLLGQTVLGRLGKIEIDNREMVLKITHHVM